ncbi:MAG: Putative hydrolase [uncultured Sphingomonadaceae bacterium]|uniref:Hydrolase n=1 Tax=uncultured Sphingomonadaceae bacterium TaxID=169976 RepID=A0A6J4SL99_9SPHN|nr:MAG: Putative hydrolase [uncultured Sphingomonadaceae bacterium]
MAAAYTDGYWWSNDGLRLHYRDYAGDPGKAPVLCIPGLTRNARDFGAVAERLAGERRVLVVELRGRGESAYAADPMSYVPLTYMQDVRALVESLGLERIVAFGTSLGGIVTMLLSATAPNLLAGALLNDIGPEIEPAGVARIASYVGRAQSHATWLHAARALADAQRDIYPDYDLERWLSYAKRLYKLTPGGRMVLDYDMKIAEPFRITGGTSGFDLWPAFDSLAGKPVTLVRGALSDLVSPETVAAMRARVPDMAVATVPCVGHAPVLDEPEAVAAIDELLGRVSG